MSKVIADMSMSLDGFVARPDDSIEPVAGWFFGGDVEVPTATPGFSFQAPAPSADMLRDALSGVGALLTGRRNFDLAKGWGGQHPMGVPVVVLTHEPPSEWRDNKNFVFVTDGIKSAVAQAKAIAGDKIVGVATPDMVRQCLEARLLDAVHINLVPVVLGQGVPYFANLAETPITLETPEVIESQGVTHLTYQVTYPN
ncbi:dihydrofolate reductase family protein [Kribbella deserti]|uniref:Dihydrofolate reductase family protein n=1 Tax=Kribbella deserti TaxID=1926257 RepID=A0ABV6QT98_9ACTN